MQGLLFSILILASCSREETVDRLSLLATAKKADPTFSIVLAEKIGAGPTCESDSPKTAYGVGCLKVFRAKVKNIEFAFVEFDNAVNAKNEAGRLNQWYYKNWVIDEVTSEPPLEQFVKSAFNAVNPREIKP
tara:strand:+ start:63 stop:458 length:396 start_codon:yes stop_codon:yes gene_type:complete